MNATLPRADMMGGLRRWLLQLSGNARYMCVYQIHFSWMCFNPIPPSHLTIPMECQELQHPPGMFHFELLYAWRCHYDVITGPQGFAPNKPRRLHFFIIWHTVVK